MPLPNVTFRFYATLLDAFSDYLNSNRIYERYWGRSENPPFTADEFGEKQFQALIDRINRVPLDSEAADRGTAFNELVDCMVENRKPSPGFIVEKIYDDMGNGKVVAVTAEYKERLYRFDIRLLREFADYYTGSVPQLHVSALLPTPKGNVQLYGYIDELLPLSVHDIKTTNSYFVGKFKSHWQHIVYPYCLWQNGYSLDSISTFEYNVAEIDKAGRWQSFTESYTFNPDRDVPRLRDHCMALITFLQCYSSLITDTKIFNQL